MVSPSEAKVDAPSRRNGVVIPTRQEDHQAAYIFNPPSRAAGPPPAKRRRTARLGDGAASKEPLYFVPLLQGAESEACVRLRQRLYQESWARVEQRVQVRDVRSYLVSRVERLTEVIKGVLRDANRATLEQVAQFTAAAEDECAEQIPSAFIMTGPNMASHQLLFDQLAEALQRSDASKVVRLRSSETANLKSALKKTIREATARTSEDEDEDILEATDAKERRYLDYDLEALDVFLQQQQQECWHVFVAFEDSEGFDSGLLSDLITLLHSWRPRIPFFLIFGVATSVELLQARLLKSACRLIYGAQFDCVQTRTILEKVVRSGVAACDVSPRLGAPLLRSLLDRQRNQIAGIQAFISSLKYAYMCHFYANPLSIMMSDEAYQHDLIQEEHVEALRHLPSFRRQVELALQQKSAASLRHARRLIEDDKFLLDQARGCGQMQKLWAEGIVRCVMIILEGGTHSSEFSSIYVRALARSANGTATDQADMVDRIRHMSAAELSSFLQRLLVLFQHGDAELKLDAASQEKQVDGIESLLGEQLAVLRELEREAEAGGYSLRNRHNMQGKVMRTTIVAQRVQLSRETAKLRAEDESFTDIVDKVSEAVSKHLADGTDGPSNVLFSECWLYDSKAPSSDVFVPRPGAVLVRSLGRPHDYLGCRCCSASEGGGGGAALPATAMLYQLYLEAGSLINVADLWAAFAALAAGDERQRLAHFYQGLAELSALGFVKASKKKVDHIAKVKWL